MKLSEDKLLGILEPQGALAQNLNGFESRKEQQSMLKDVIDAFNGGKVALIEAGTGCGKSIAYLIPSLIAAKEFNERIVISTNTINLQEQLFFKDLPLLLKALNLELNVVLVKGMGNYVCKRKFEESFEERLLYTSEEKEEMETLSAQIDRLQEGTRSEIGVLNHSVWEKISAEHDTCSYKGCPHFDDCYFFKARKTAEEAQILIVNHHLLFADLSSRAFEDKAVLPSYQYLIIDEAHNIEEVATDFFSTSISRLGLLKTVGRLSAEKNSKISHGKLPQLKEKIEKAFHRGLPEEMISLISRLQIDIPALKRDTLTALIDCFESMETHLFPQNIDEELKLRIKETFHDSKGWKACEPKVKGLVESLKKFSISLKGVDQDLENYEHDRLDELTKGIRFEISALASRLDIAASNLEAFQQPVIPPNKVRWIEHSPPRNMSFEDANLDLSTLFKDHLFNKMRAVILCSATLTSGRSFHFIKNRLGLYLTDKEKIEKIYNSPFNYERQALFICPNDLPSPDTEGYEAKMIETLKEALISSKGGAFCLFTSYSQLKNVYKALEGTLLKQGFSLFKQGTLSRKQLIEAFKAAKKPVLFGTDSFWEGVDVAGNQLRLVAIGKLPFKVPSEPITQARSEKLQSQGIDPFREYSLPHAIVKFKQGFGRLIRTASDRGVVLCLDPRLLTKNYGSSFLKSLPNCGKAFIPTREVKSAIESFFKQSY